ncbi:MAG: M20/M25/M40 family metallo-hydrolase [Candidatus Thorarchaeota archaeon]
MNVNEETVSLVQTLIRNKCVNPPGDEIRSIKTIEQYLNTYGVECEVFEPSPGKGNLLATITGTGEKPSLMFGPSHVDVVPVENEDAWKHDPFSGDVADGCIWGRGAFDMLFIVACQTAVFAHLHAQGFKPKGDLKLLIVSDEEIGGTYGAKWMVENHPEKVRTDFLVTELGGFEIAPGRVAFQYGEKGHYWVRIGFQGQEQHGSMPFKSDNAIIKLAKAIVRLTEYQTPITTEFIKKFVKDLPLSGFQKWLLKRRFLLPRILDMLSKSDMARARLLDSLCRMTMSPNLCGGGSKVNVVAGSAYVDVDIRTLPNQNEEYIISHLKEALGVLSKEARIEPREDSSVGNASDIDNAFVSTMTRVVRELKGPDAKLIPMLNPGATDCRFFREAFNTQAYGFAVLDNALPVNELVRMPHGDNERVTLETLRLTSESYRMLAEMFLK